VRDRLSSQLIRLFPPQCCSLALNEAGWGPACVRIDRKVTDYCRSRLTDDRFVEWPRPFNNVDPHRHSEDIYSYLNLRVYHDSLRVMPVEPGKRPNAIPPWSQTSPDARYVAWEKGGMFVWDVWSDSVFKVTMSAKEFVPSGVAWKDSRTLVFDRVNLYGGNMGGAHVELDMPTRSVVWAVPYGDFAFARKAESQIPPAPARPYTLKCSVADGTTRNRLAVARVTVDGRTASTDDDGRCELRGIAAGEHALTVSCRGYFPRTLRTMGTNRANETANVLLYDSTYCRVFGRVVDADDGHGVKGLDVSADNQRVRARVDEDGNYVLDGLRPGAYTLRIFPSGTGHCQAYQDVIVHRGAATRADISTEKSQEW
jgi:hypothetical protein